MTVPRLLLLTGTPPGFPGVGGIFLRDLCLSYPRDKICCFSVTNWSGPMVPPELAQMPAMRMARPLQEGVARLGPVVHHVSGAALRQYARLAWTRRAHDQAVQFGRQHRAQTVWAILNSPNQIHLASSVAKSLGVPLVLGIWDPPERLAVDFGLDVLSRRALMRDFAHTLSVALRCGVASDEMAAEYQRRYRVEPVVMIHGVDSRLRRPPASGPADEGRLVIGVAGSLYAGHEWRALLAALSSVDWRVDGRDVTVRIMGSGVHVEAEGRARVEYLGWRSLGETIDVMSQVDVTYLPYWFDKRYGLAARFCFPNKLSTYLAAGRPILFHGPEDSSPAHFFEKFPVGLCCHSLERSEIIEALRRFATDRALYVRAADAGLQALDRELDARVFRRRFAALIGIGDDELVPLG